MKIDNGYFYDIEPVIDIYHFVELFLVTLAKRDTLQPVIIDTRTTRVAILKTDYKEKIESLMYSEDAINFLKLIDSYHYYEKQSGWELKLANNFKEYLKKNNKVANYNFEHDHVEVTYSVEEINEILKNYDEEIQELMEDLVFFIESNRDYERHSKLVNKEGKRNSQRAYIASSPTAYTNVWTKMSPRAEKTIKITINPQYIKK